MAKVRKLLITGGHVTPALAVVDALAQKNIKCDVVFVGRKYVNNRETANSFEYNEVTKRNIPFIHLKAGRLTRVANMQSFLSFLNIPAGVIAAYKIISYQKPDIVLTFGGYIGLPIAIAARLKGIPIYSHEQTIHPGIANRLISKMAKRIFVAFAESAKYFNKKRVIVSGNPIRAAVFSKGKAIFKIPALPCIYITGGSLGAHSVNTHIERILPELLKKFVVIHQTGNVREFKDFERLAEFKSTLKSEIADRYFPQEHFLDDQIGWVYSVSDFVVGRSGANTFFELMALEKPAVFIPLPWSANDEQRRQAMIFKEKGLGEVFEQNRSSSELLSLIEKVNSNLSDYQNCFALIDQDYHTHAEDTIIDTIFKA
ncbi:undecaprenyldiphospho-muramoylpentapeptide beta-N-acetylglucosaminyltransferase [soil metagenome]